MNRHIFSAPTEHGAKLDLTYEQEHNCKVVYKKTSAHDGKYIFAGLWHPELNYSDQHVIVPLRSVFGGTENYPARQVFANIIGSTKDPRPVGYSSWLDILKGNGIDCTTCATDTWFYSPTDYSGATYFKDYRCDGGTLVGGHVVADFNNQDTNNLIGKTVHLIPICHNHNSCCTDTSGNNGAGFYMLARQSGKAIVLNSYFQVI